MNNTSGLLPCGRAVLVKPYQPDIAAGSIIIPDTIKVTTQILEQRATVVAIGPEAWKGEDGPRAKVGQKVLISAYAGYMAKGSGDGEQYRFVNDRDIFATIEDESYGH